MNHPRYRSRTTLLNQARALERQANALRNQNHQLRNGIELRNQQMQNSLFSLVQSAGSQSALGSFNSLAYHNIYSPLTINWTMLTYMYKTHGIIQSAVDMPVLDAMRGGIDIHSDELDKDEIKELQDKLEQDGVLTILTEAAIWTRLYGGGAIIVNTEQDPEEPLEMTNLEKIELYAANRWEVVAPNRYAEQYNFYGDKFDKSRILTMAAKPAPYIVRWTLQGWGMSEVERMVEDFNAFIRTKDVVYELLKEAKIDVYQFENFTAQLSSQAGTNMTQARVELMNKFKSYQNAIVMDIKDKFEQKQITFAGLADVMKQNMVNIASAIRIPMTKLFGLSASGFSSGEDDIENYNAMVESEVRTPLRPTIRAVLGLYTAQLFGDKFDISFDFKPLRVMSSVEEENVKTQKHARYADDYQKGILNSQEYAELLQHENLLPVETEVARGAEPEIPGSGMGAEDTPFGDKGLNDEPVGDRKEFSVSKNGHSQNGFHKEAA